MPTEWPSPLLPFSPSLPYKGRKIDLMTNRKERQSAAACCPPRPPPSLLSCSGSLQDTGLGEAEAGGEEVGRALLPAFRPLESSFDWEWGWTSGSWRLEEWGKLEMPPYTRILDKWQLMAGNCLSQGHAEGQTSEGWAEFWPLLSGAKRLGPLSVGVIMMVGLVGRGQEAGRLEMGRAWAENVSEGILKV